MLSERHPRLLDAYDCLASADGRTDETIFGRKVQAFWWPASPTKMCWEMTEHLPVSNSIMDGMHIHKLFFHLGEHLMKVKGQPCVWCHGKYGSPSRKSFQDGSWGTVQAGKMVIHSVAFLHNSTCFVVSFWSLSLFTLMKNWLQLALWGGQVVCSESDNDIYTLVVVHWMKKVEHRFK